MSQLSRGAEPSCLGVSDEGLLVRATQGESSLMIKGRMAPGLTSSEELLLCGKWNPQNEKDAAPIDVPLSQKISLFKGFLQSRGYHRPVVQAGEGHASVVLDIGPIFRVTQIKVTWVSGEAEHSVSIDATGDVVRSDGLVNPTSNVSSDVLDVLSVGEDSLSDLGLRLLRGKTDLVGRVLTPKFLDELDHWTLSRLQSMGYACATVKSSGDPLSGVVALVVHPGARAIFGRVDEDEVVGLLRGVIRRYDAFDQGQIFNQDLLELTTTRLKTDRILQSAYFSTDCKEGRLQIKQHLSAGLPRVLSIGVGANTEGFLLGRVNWKNTRLSEQGSSLEYLVEASSRIQRFEALLDWYFLPPVSRLSLQPSVEFKHRNETFFEFFSTQAELRLNRTFDFESWGGKYFLGPSGEWIRTLRGIGPQDAQLLNMQAGISFESHAFEINRSDPLRGYQASLIGVFSDRRVLSSVSASKIDFRFRRLWNFLELDPSLLVVGVRGGFGLTLPRSGQDLQDLPVSYRRFLGGSQDIRGFGRQGLGSTDGALSLFFTGVEARLRHQLPFEIDPFVFFDFGFLGSSAAQFDAPLYWSPGLGLRIASIIGPIRASIGKGFVDGQDMGTQMYFSLGEEF